MPSDGKGAELEGRKAPSSGWCPKGWIDARSKGPGDMELPTSDEKATADPKAALQEGRGSPEQTPESPAPAAGIRSRFSCQ